MMVSSSSETLRSTVGDGASNRPTYDGLILDAGLRQSLVTVRSLGQRGLRVAAVECARSVPAFSSRWCQQGFICSAETGTEEYLAYLEQLLDRSGARVVITSADGTLALLRRHRAHLEQKVRLAIAKEAALDLAVNKEKTFAVAEQLGLLVPKGMKLTSAGELPTALREIGLPAVVKPVESWLWEGEQGARLTCKLVTTPAEARRAVEQLTACNGEVFFQHFLAGRRESIHLFYAHGEVYACFAQWARRTQPPLGGTSVFRQSIAVPADIGEQTERLVRAIDLEGYSEVEFRRDQAGKPYLMEINPRLSASVEVAVRAGVDFPLLLYQWANGEPLERIPGYRIGGWMRYLEGDTLTTVQAVAERGRPGVPPPTRAIFDFFAAFFIPSGYDYFHWKDLRPAWAAAVQFYRSVPGRVRKRLRKS